MISTVSSQFRIAAVCMVHIHDGSALPNAKASGRISAQSSPSSPTTFLAWRTSRAASSSRQCPRSGHDGRGDPREGRGSPPRGPAREHPSGAGGRGRHDGLRGPEARRRFRHAGYITRVVEVEMFEPGQANGRVDPRDAERAARGHGDWARAVTEACTDLANSEPLGKPNHEDERARTWRIPGPGGHVRHYASSRAIGEELGRVNASGAIGDPAELKRLWLYGFFVRACEEAVPPTGRRPRRPSRPAGGRRLQRRGRRSELRRLKSLPGASRC